MQFIVIVSLSKDVNAKMCNIKRTSAQDPINFDADPDPGSALEKNGSGSRLLLTRFSEFFNKAKIFNFVLFCLLIFVYNFNMVYMFIYFLLNVYISLLLIVQILVQRVKKFFLQLQLVDILPLGSKSVDPHIFADQDPDPESKNLADPTGS